MATWRAVAWAGLTVGSLVLSSYLWSVAGDAVDALVLFGVAGAASVLAAVVTGSVGYGVATGVIVFAVSVPGSFVL